MVSRTRTGGRSMVIFIEGLWLTMGMIASSARDMLFEIHGGVEDTDDDEDFIFRF